MSVSQIEQFFESLLGLFQIVGSIVGTIAILGFATIFFIRFLGSRSSVNPHRLRNRSVSKQILTHYDPISASATSLKSNKAKGQR